MDSTQKPLSPPPSTFLNIANALSSKPSSENTNGWKRIANLFHKVLSDIQRYAQLLVDNCSDEPEMGVMFGVEYMSKGALKGGFLERSLQITQQQLEKLCEENPQNIEFKKALDEITFAFSIAQTISESVETNNERSAKKIIEKITLLKNGEGILLPIRCNTKRSAHAMMARIVCTNTTLPKRYTFKIYNEGQGLTLYHRLTNDLYNSTLSWQDVPLNKLTEDFFTHFLNHGISDNRYSIETFYNLLNHTLGKARRKNPDSKNLTTGQRGGSCSAQSILSALRDLLPPKEYQALKSHLRHNYLYKIYTRITLGDSNPILPLITLELIHKIEKNKGKAGSFSKFSDLDKVKQKMETTIAAQSLLKTEDQQNPQKQIAAFFKGNSDIVSQMTESTLKTVIEEIKTTPCTKKQFEAIQNKAQEYNILLHSIKKRFTRSKGNIKFQKIISDEGAIKRLHLDSMLDLLRRITSQEITCKHSEFYNIKAQAKKLGIQIPEELDKRFPEPSSS